MPTAWPEPQHEPISWETFLDIDEDTRRDLEIVDGYVVPREQRSRPHQKVGRRLANAVEGLAIERVRETGRAECYEVNTEVEVLLWELPATARRPDVVLHQCLPEYEQLETRHVVIVAEVISTYSVRRDRVHKMGEYAAAGIPHCWLLEFDKDGALSLEHYALVGDSRTYTKIGSSHRDMGPDAINVTAPFPIRIGWAQLGMALLN